MTNGLNAGPAGYRKISDLSDVRILVTNDDGINAPGLAVLEKVARSLSDDVWVVAPEVEQSAMSHALTLRRPLRVIEKGEQRFAIDGTPTDCVVMANAMILRDRAPDLVLSGVNRGGNIGDDVTYSGTVAASMEATLLGIPAIAFSQVLGGDGEACWETAETHLPSVLQRLAAHGWPRHSLFNVNFPPVRPDQVLGVRATQMGHFQGAISVDRVTDPKDQPCYWIGDFDKRGPFHDGTDMAVVDEGFISVTPINMNLTDQAELSRLSQFF